MKEEKINITYQIGSFLVTQEDSKYHIDQVCEYILTREGLYVILILDVLKDPRRSTKISIKDIMNKWKYVDSKMLKEVLTKHKNSNIEESNDMIRKLTNS